VFGVRELERAVDHYERLRFTSSRRDDGYAFVN
jgi:hypothetical protein